MTTPVTPPPTQVRHSWRATVRTGIQTALGLAAAAPIVIVMSGADRNYAAAGTALLVAGAFTKVMAIPEVNALLTKLGLGAEPRDR
jgi:hypothetical protein